ncbi:MAG TPA: nodulation protein NfeD [Steroidobacter sp.]|nr:nodulation protein NfeD [Steroidobacter sp.]
MNTRRLFWLALLTMAAIGTTFGAAEKSDVDRTNTALLLTIHDAIGPATSSFFLRTLDEARERNARLVILELDTPGGLDSAMREMIQAILASPIPVAIYVSPSGSRAASAGTYLLYASHIAAMAPATNLGAATPVQIGPSSPTPPDEKDKDDKNAAPEPATAMERKAVNDSIAYIRGLAELRGRNADWAEDAVRSATSLTATAALQQNVIDLLAADLPDLLRQIDGRKVKTGMGEVTLSTSGLTIERVETDWRTRVLAVITNPNVAYLLMLVGVYGLLLEGYNPGSILPGVAGGIALLLALYAFQVLSVNYAGLALIILGIALMIAEAFAPSFGVLGVGGVLAFVIGSVILMDTEAPGFQIARPLIGGMALAGALVMLLMASYFVRSRRRPVVTGNEQLLSERAIAMADFEGSGPVRVRGEIWYANARSPVRKGERLRVVRVAGLTLDVEPDRERSSAQR